MGCGRSWVLPNALILRIVSILVTRGDGAMNVDHDETGETGGQRHAAGTGGERHGVDIHFTATHSENPGDIDRSAGDKIYGSSDGG